MMAISEHVRAKGLNQTEAANLFSVTQPRMSDLLRGKISLFSLDMLVGMLSAAGIGVEMKVKPPIAPKKETTQKAKIQHRVARVGAKAARRRVAA
jgi:plasmid maintenance system antidote protein VapI